MTIVEWCGIINNQSDYSRGSYAMSDETLNSTINKIGFTSSDLQEYLSQKALKHRNYRHYSKCDRIQGILDTGYIYLNNGQKWNDIIDRENFQNNISGKTNFGLCLTYSMSESIAFWMLYSRFEGRMINFTRQIIEDIINTSRIVNIGQFKNEGFIVFQEYELNTGEIFISDIIYYDTDLKHPNEYRINHSDEKREYVDKAIIDNLDFIKKTNAWSYEKECRLIIQLPNEIIERIKKNPKYEPSESISAQIKISDNLIPQLKERVIESPNTNNTEYTPSTLRNKIDWNVCCGCDLKKKG